MATKYQPLVDYIAAQTEDAVTLSFPEIEALVGAPLPETMQVDTWQWTNREVPYVWRLGDLGWRAHLDRRNRRVVFTRDAERQAFGKGMTHAEARRYRSEPLSAGG